MWDSSSSCQCASRILSSEMWHCVMCLKFTDASQRNITAIFKLEVCSSARAPHRISQHYFITFLLPMVPNLQQQQQQQTTTKTTTTADNDQVKFQQRPQETVLITLWKNMKAWKYCSIQFLTSVAGGDENPLVSSAYDTGEQTSFFTFAGKRSTILFGRSARSHFSLYAAL